MYKTPPVLPQIVMLTAVMESVGMLTQGRQKRLTYEANSEGKLTIPGCKGFHKIRGAIFIMQQTLTINN